MSLSSGLQLFVFVAEKNLQVRRLNSLKKYDVAVICERNEIKNVCWRTDGARQYT